MEAQLPQKYAIFFPQFHRVKVNDDAWGYGFTDWVLIAGANAFSQWERRAPRGGFYDLNDPEVVRTQFECAANSGLDGFGIYHYRFEDGPELAAVERYLADATLPKGFQYFFVWANEDWSKRWAGKDTELLKSVPTRPTCEQVRDHVEYLKPFLAADAYRRLGERPLFVIYRPEFFVDPESTVGLYREEFARVGIDIALGYFVSSPSDVKYSRIFDFCYLFEPRLFFRFKGLGRSKILTAIYRFLIHAIAYSYVESLSKIAKKITGRRAVHHTFSEFMMYFCSSARAELINSLACPVQNVLTCGWNNSPRYRDRFTALANPSPIEFRETVHSSIKDSSMSDDLPLMCNAWNEWSEGAALEPCAYLGDDFLKIFGKNPNSVQLRKTTSL